MRVEDQNLSKIKARQEWSTARRRIGASRLQVLREAAARLNTDWQSGSDAQFEKDFFLEQQSQKKFENRRRKLHDLVDDVMTKRRRKEYAGEKTRLDKEIQTDQDSDGEDSSDEIDLQDEEDLSSGCHTPPRQVQEYHDEVPSAEERYFTIVTIQATSTKRQRIATSRSFRQYNEYFFQIGTSDGASGITVSESNFTLSGADQALYNEAAAWFKSMIGRDAETTIQRLRNNRFREPWVHDLLYDRLKLLRTGIDPACDENTYTSFWVTPDFVALQTGVPGLISNGFANENHFTPSAWRRALSRRKLFAKGTYVDAYYFARDNHVDIVLENVGSPTCTNHVKHDSDKKKCHRNAADTLLDRFYNSTGSFEIAKDYRIILVVVFGHEVTLYTASIKGCNEYNVSKVFQGKYHFSKDVYLANLLVHIRFCLTIKTIMEMNADVSILFGNSIESLPQEEQAHSNMKLHTTPTMPTMRSTVFQPYMNQA
ncbi:hypothetical protein BGX34_001411 [Mortierella sp. NVP85]|nr:hypothetical protein BGX34_001411 [Mortierella sp. NVP85]